MSDRLTIQLSPEAAAALAPIAREDGVSPEGWLSKLAEERVKWEAGKRAKQPKRDVSRYEARGHIHYWLTALNRQQQRAIDPAPDSLEQQIDVDLFAITLAQFIVAVELSQRFDGAIQTALAEFHLKVPEAKHIRNVITHFDQYDLGRGIDQTVKGPARFDPQYWFSGPSIELWLEDHTLDVTAARDAANELYEAVGRILMHCG